MIQMEKVGFRHSFGLWDLGLAAPRDPHLCFRPHTQTSAPSVLGVQAGVWPPGPGPHRPPAEISPSQTHTRPLSLGGRAAIEGEGEGGVRAVASPPGRGRADVGLAPAPLHREQSGGDPPTPQFLSPPLERRLPFPFPFPSPLTLFPGDPPSSTHTPASRDPVTTPLCLPSGRGPPFFPCPHPLCVFGGAHPPTSFPVALRSNRTLPPAKGAGFLQPCRRCPVLGCLH